MQTGYLKITNKGEIDVEAFRLLGASTKRDDLTKIGFFGSGLKYAMAVLLREEIPFKVFSGKDEVKITVKETMMREQKFGVIHVNGKATSLTTEMGPTWEPWFCVREIFCNAIDEGDHNIGLAGEATGEIGKTLFYIGVNEKLKRVLDDWNLHFSEKRQDLVHTSTDIKFYQGGHKTIIYRKGIQVYESETPSLYHYDVHDISINESRVISSDWEWKTEMCRKVAEHASVTIIEDLVYNYLGKVEEDFNWEYAYTFNQNWLKVFEGKWLVPKEYAGSFLEEMEGKSCIQLPSRWLNALKSKFGKKLNIVGTVNDDGDIIKSPTEHQQKYIDEAKSFLGRAGFPVNHEVVICEFKSPKILGRAHKEKIMLSPKLFELGRKMIISVMLEEEAHLYTGYGDYTRGFQDYLFSRIVTLMEEKIGERL